MDHVDDLDKLRAEYPDWLIGTRWVRVASGPDAVLFWAASDEKCLTAWTVAGLAGQLRGCYKLHVTLQ